MVGAKQDTTSGTTREVSGAPPALPLYLKAALPSLPGAARIPGVRKTGAALPQLTLVRHDVPVDRSHLIAYSRVCGFRVGRSLPLTYPHLLAFPLHMRLMTDTRFPFPVLGLVHVENTITAHRVLSPDENLQVGVRAEDLRAHPKGQAFDVVTDVHSGGELVWHETSTFLRRGRPTGSAADTGRTFEEVTASGTEWKLSGDLGRRYAAASGDRNPIHLYRLAAKAFGFPRQIAHGMWSKARCLAALEGRLPDAVTVEVAFKKPILLPGRVGFGSQAVPSVGAAGDVSYRDYAFSMTDPKSGAPHVLGRTTSPTT